MTNMYKEMTNLDFQKCPLVSQREGEQILRGDACLR